VRADLGANELLTITINEQVIAGNLTAGSTLSEIISQLNGRFEDESIALQAVDDNGQLKIETLNYGSGETFKIRSNQEAATANQLGIGTTETTLTGVDVAGTINGIAGTGSGQTLTGDKEQVGQVIGLLQVLLEGWRGIQSTQHTPIVMLRPCALRTDPRGFSIFRRRLSHRSSAYLIIPLKLLLI
jgi:hypothetical protein